MFGMWKDLLPNHMPNASPKKPENIGRQVLWDQALSAAFAHGDDPDGSVTFWRVAHLHRLRNRVSHMEVLLDTDVQAHMREVFDLVASISPAAKAWLSGISDVGAVLKQQPGKQ